MNSPERMVASHHALRHMNAVAFSGEVDIGSQLETHQIKAPEFRF